MSLYSETNLSTAKHYVYDDYVLANLKDWFEYKKEFKLYEGDKIKFYLVVKKDKNGQFYIYDKISKKKYHDRATKYFLCGPVEVKKELK